ncbi:hypothetical protein MKZ38_001647 [Zalerion maritima]|uniref:AB hydrolase-1 domain-containing protein n=1 Tax=Zalerion maritima TaxID=339359 RepID=A0AAD5RFK1_9PEZI|nr:hypothetical protein MKZ38_001647 [Zalerion maritima]
MSSAEPTPAQSAAREYIANPNFHQTFTLPSTAEHGELTVSYADIGRVSSSPSETDVNRNNISAILFMQGMFASRYVGTFMHAIAEKLGVRVLTVDRPGFGKSTDVPLHMRIPVWIELVPLLLAHVGIEHVSLMAHSAGAIYLLNTLYSCRDILHPARPFVALLAPWVDPSCSRVASMQAAQYLPTTVFSIWNRIPQFYLFKAGPAFASSGAVVSKVALSLPSIGSTGAAARNQETSEQDRNRNTLADKYGLSREMQINLETEIPKLMFSENTVGANSEALQCLRKGSGWTWGECNSYEKFVKELVQMERLLNRSDGHSGEEKAKLKVRTYFAASDAMVGKKGQLYMEGCWKGEDNATFRDVLNFESSTVLGVDHDGVVLSTEVLEKVFVLAGGVMSTPAAGP